MTMTRAMVACARSFLGILAIGGAALLAGCGGGSGAPNNPYDKGEVLPGPLTVLPSTATLYGGTPSVFTITGGSSPYRVFSSDSSVLPLEQEVSGNEFVALPANVAADTSVVITARDNTGQTATAEATVRAAPLVNGLVIAADASPTSCGGTDAAPENGAVVCSGDTGTATVTMAGPGNAVQSGRQIRFDAVQGDFAFFTGNSAQPQASTVTVATDATGKAIARFQVGVNAPSGFALMRATDLSTGHQVTGSFTIAQIVSGENTLTVVPETATITTLYKGNCSSGFVIDYYVFGGTPPYTVNSTFPQAVSLSRVPVLTNGGSFRVTTAGICVDPLQFTITDATGRTVTAELVNQPGSEDPPAPTPPAELVVSPASVTSAACDGNTFQFVVVGGSPIYNVSASTPGVTINPQIVRTSGATFTVTGLANGSGKIVINVVDSGGGQDQQLATADITCN